jgi:preprotein translocase subunit SecD
MGTAVDANIIYERARRITEEITRKLLKLLIVGQEQCVQSDANVTHILLVLYCLFWFWTIKGFATTLLIGIITLYLLYSKNIY